MIKPYMLHVERCQWKENLKFYEDELDQLLNRISKILQNSPGDDFYHLKTRIGQVKEELIFLLGRIQKADESDQSSVQDHNSYKELMNLFENRFYRLKADIERNCPVT